jgi:hypothetical protein
MRRRTGVGEARVGLGMTGAGARQSDAALGEALGEVQAAADFE